MSSVQPDSLTFELAALDLDKESEDYSLYFLIKNDDGELSPVLLNHRVLVFTEYEHTWDALKQAGYPDRKETFEEVFDVQIGEAFSLIQQGSYDPSFAILNMINTFDDIVKTLKMTPPTHYKRVLYHLADHLTFDKEFGAFIEQQPLSRPYVYEALIWYTGAVMSNLTFYSAQQPPKT